MFVRLSGTGVHCEYTARISTDLSLWLDSPMFWTPKHVHLLAAVFFQFHLEVRWSMEVRTVTCY